MDALISLPTSYSSNYLRFDRVFPLIDLKLQALIKKVKNQEIPIVENNFLDHSAQVIGISKSETRDLFNLFKQQFQKSLENNKQNNIQNLNTAARVDICSGCTQYIDTLYMTYGPDGIQVLEREYTYHGRLNPKIEYKTESTLIPKVPLIISQPFFHGRTFINMPKLLDRCLELKIPVHIDGAWVTACKNINMDFSHPAIESYAVSMSKGYGLSGWNRIGLRWIKDKSVVDAITIMNDFVQVPAQSVVVGLYFLNQVDPGHLWNAHADRYKKICEDFNLTPTDSIHLAMQGNNPVGVESLIRYLEANSL